MSGLQEEAIVAASLVKASWLFALPKNCGRQTAQRGPDGLRIRARRLKQLAVVPNPVQANSQLPELARGNLARTLPVALNPFAHVVLEFLKGLECQLLGNQEDLLNCRAQGQG
jgi:hypothetical protein